MLSVLANISEKDRVEFQLACSLNETTARKELGIFIRSIINQNRSEINKIQGRNLWKIE